MLMSNLFGERLRSKPAEASLISHVFLLRGGYIRPVGSGIYSLLTPCIKVQRKIENIIREEMDKIGGQEILMPMVVPADLWKQSGRFYSVGNELLRLKDRANRDMVLSMTHEEPAVYLANTEAKSYLDYPFMIYQIQTKFRDEPRARGGLIRVREFTMKDAYSFHTSFEDLDNYYEKVHKAYERIFERVGLEVVSIYSDTGMMGGTGAHEFMLISDAGEDSIIICNNCGYKANMEVAKSKLDEPEPEEIQECEEIYTPNVCTIDELANSLNINSSKIIKAVVYYAESLKKPVIVFIRGDLQVNEAKLRNYLKSEVSELTNLNDYKLTQGFIGPDDRILDNFVTLFDNSLKNVYNMIVGANKENYHIKNFNLSKNISKSLNFCDVSKVKEGQHCPQCGKPLSVKRGIEMGNIFKLGTKYTESMDMKYVDKDGTQKYPIMGCYGIGVGRLIAGVVEASHDEYGPIWPKSIAPWQIHICALNFNNEKIKSKSLEIYDLLKNKYNYDVLLDDRNLSAGVQFADADLLSAPIRIIISKRNIENNKLEIIIRSTRESILIDSENLCDFIENFYKN